MAPHACEQRESSIEKRTYVGVVALLCAVLLLVPADHAPLVLPVQFVLVYLLLHLGCKQMSTKERERERKTSNGRAVRLGCGLRFMASRAMIFRT
jgi:hypothetical protein